MAQWSFCSTSIDGFFQDFCKSGVLGIELTQSYAMLRIEPHMKPQHQRGINMTVLMQSFLKPLR